MKTKQDFEGWYEKENPWGVNNTLNDRVRRKIVIRQLQSISNQFEIKSALDAGCGEGFVTKDIVNEFHPDTDAFDISNNAIAFAKIRNKDPQINYYQLDLNDFQANKEYDLLVCEEALYYLDEHERKTALNKFHQSIRKDGFLKISVVIIGENKHRKYFTLDSITDLLTESGFQIYSILPSVIEAPRGLTKILFRFCASAYHRKPLPVFESLQMAATLSQPLSNCYQVSILCRKN